MLLSAGQVKFTSASCSVVVNRLLRGQDDVDGLLSRIYHEKPYRGCLILLSALTHFYLCILLVCILCILLARVQCTRVLVVCIRK